MKMKPAEMKNLAGLEVVNHQGDRVFHQNHDACQYRSENKQADDTLERRGTAVVLPESIQKANFTSHVQSTFLLTGDAARIDTDRGVVDRLGYLAARLDYNACQYRSDDSDRDGNFWRRGTALVGPESPQVGSCLSHIQSPAYRCHMTTRVRTLLPFRPVMESESRMGLMRRAPA